MFQNGGKASGESDPCRIPFGGPLSRTSFLEKGPPKITEGGPFEPHRPISRINPVTVGKFRHLAVQSSVNRAKIFHVPVPTRCSVNFFFYLVENSSVTLTDESAYL